MSEKEVIAKEKLKSYGIFNFKDFYEYAAEWFKEEDYTLNEEKYSEKISGNQREIEIIWNASVKINDYYKKDLKVEFNIRRLEDVEVEIDGKKKKANRGEVNLKIKGTLVKDHGSKWEDSALIVFFRGIYDKYIIPKKTEDMEDDVFDSVRDFKEEMKAFLELSGKL